MFMDATLYGWGAHVGMEDLSVKGTWTVEESRLSINILEMKAVILGVQAFQSTLRGKCITLFSDNSTVVAYIRKQGGTHSDTLCRLTWDFLQLCSHLGTELSPRHIPGKWNILADALSRADRLVQTEWTLHWDVVRTLVGMWDAPTVDLFATRLNKRLPYSTPLSRTTEPWEWTACRPPGRASSLMRTLPLLSSLRS
jgi:ribonuclease HI